MKRIAFLTGTRADFGKLKSLVAVLSGTEFDAHIFATGMHMSERYGKTIDEIAKSGFTNIHPFINEADSFHMDRTLAKTIEGFSRYINELKPDLIVVHGDRCEALAGAISGALNNILVAHVEGGELSGTIDDSIRHAVSKLAHIHLVANTEARSRLCQLGELPSSIKIIGSPDLDLMNPRSLPRLEVVKNHYDIKFTNYAIAMFHPVTTEFAAFRLYAKNFVEALLQSEKCYVLVLPNNDLGSALITEEYEVLRSHPKFKIFPSIRFEYFLRLLQSADFMIGNSSAGVREAPFYNVPSIDIGNRQANRIDVDKFPTILQSGYVTRDIYEAIVKVEQMDLSDTKVFDEFGDGNSDELFLALLRDPSFWGVSCQKTFQDI